MKIQCTTYFDITKTGVSNRRGHLDGAAGKERQQQANFETLLQVFSLRSQPEDITDPVKSTTEGSTKWSFTFSVSSQAVYFIGDDLLGGLKQDCSGVPMVVGLDEASGIQPILAPDVNIFFMVVNE